MFSVYIKITPSPSPLSNDDIPQQVGCSFGVFGEGMKVSGKNTLLPEGSLGVFSLP